MKIEVTASSTSLLHTDPFLNADETAVKITKGKRLKATVSSWPGGEKRKGCRVNGAHDSAAAGRVTGGRIAAGWCQYGARADARAV